MIMHPAFFFDRDGVVNVSPGSGYVTQREDFHLSEGIVEALAFLKSRGFKLIVVSSQQGVGKGLMSQADLDDVHAFMQAELRAHGAEFDGIYYCPHLNGTCSCRKPSPEMIKHAAADHSIDLSKSWLIGDHDRDIQMAINAGVPHTIRIRSDKPIAVTADHTLDAVSELPALLKQFV
jgi:D-glycero-D-manno-heptose 1,7-bisphosphate phosphatase